MLQRSTTEIFYEAFAAEITATWASTPFVREVANIAFFRAATAFLERNQEAVDDRRDLLYCILKKDFKHDRAEDTINTMRSVLPSDSGVVKRAIRNLCTAYITPPERVFGEGGKDTKKFKEFYEQGSVDEAMHRAYKIARLTNTALVMPVVRDGELELDVYSADTFRVKTAGNNYRRIEELWLQTVVGDDIAYHVWTDVSYRLLSAKDASVLQESVNPYGVIPAVALKLSKERDFYGGGLWELIEAQLDISKLQFFADQNVTYAGFAVWVAQNFGVENFVLSPNKIITVNKITAGEGQFLPPQLDAVSPDSHYNYIEDLRDRREKRALRQLGLPNSLLSENTGTQSGISRIVEMQDLLLVQREDQNALRRFEREVCRVIATVVNANFGKGLPENGDVSVNFADPQIFTEPEKEYALFKTQWTDGVMSTAEFVRRTTGNETVKTNEEGIKLIKANQELLNQLKDKEQNNGNNGNNNGVNEPDNAGNPPRPDGAGGDASGSSEPATGGAKSSGASNGDDGSDGNKGKAA